MMKTKTLFIAAIIAWQTPPIGAAQVTLCTTLDTFAQLCKSGQQCCPNGDYTVTYSCPTNWTRSGTTCSRNATSGSDDIGYYEQNYGTCNAVEFKQDCCTISTGASITCISCKAEIM